jgi:hypothetical protein
VTDHVADKADRRVARVVEHGFDWPGRTPALFTDGQLADQEHDVPARTPLPPMHLHVLVRDGRPVDMRAGGTVLPEDRTGWITYWRTPGRPEPGKPWRMELLDRDGTTTGPERDQ